MQDEKKRQVNSVFTKIFLALFDALDENKNKNENKKYTLIQPKTSGLMHQFDCKKNV